jgi:hypothetical protein
LVASYRAQITAKLSRAGRIRGQPRMLSGLAAPTQSHSHTYKRSSTGGLDVKEESTSCSPSLPGDTNINADVMLNSNIGMLFKLDYVALLKSFQLGPSNSILLPTFSTSDTSRMYYPSAAIASTSAFQTTGPFTFIFEGNLGQDMDPFRTNFEIPSATPPVDSSSGYLLYFTHYQANVHSLQIQLVGTELTDFTNLVGAS